MMQPETHDRVLGIISHLPHVLVYALVNTLARTRVRHIDLKTYCAGGFKDFTRIASSRPELWRDICLLNRHAIGQSLGDYIKSLEQLKRWIEQGKGTLLEKEFARAMKSARKCRVHDDMKQSGNQNAAAREISVRETSPSAIARLFSSIAHGRARF
jgi:prephenate dehydrogenase